MIVHMLTTEMTVPLPRPEVFAFFAEAGNLERITPPSLRFEMITREPITLSKGATIDYRLRLFGIPLRWRTLISKWEPPAVFVDEQLRGPYAYWEHTHRFYERDSGTVIEDVLRYALPFGPLGTIVHPLVRLQLRHIFAFRQQVVREHFQGTR